MRRTWIVPAVILMALVSASARAQDARAVQPRVAEPRLAAPRAVQPPAAAPRAVQRAGTFPRSPLAGFSVVLVAGSESGETTTGNLPTAAAKALADMKDFLPYKSYRLLDTQWTAASMAGEIRSRLRGLDGGDYTLQLRYSSSPDGGISVGSFTLAAAGARTTGARAGENQVRQLNARLAMLAAQRDAARANDSDLTSRARANELESEIRHAETARAQAERQLGVAPRAEEPIINTRFAMDVGETIVVGTSRLQGDNALIVLLTAVGRK